MNFYTTEDLNNMDECRTYLCNMYDHLILYSDRKTRKTDFLIDYAIKENMKKSDSKILFLVGYEHEKNRLYQKIIQILSNNNSFNYNKTPNGNSIKLLNGSGIVISCVKNEIYRGYKFDMVLIDDANEVFNTYDRIMELNRIYNIITDKIIMTSIYDLKYISSIFQSFNVDKNTSIGIFRRLKIEKIRNNILMV